MSDAHDEEVRDYDTLEAVRITAKVGDYGDLFFLTGCDIEDTIRDPAVTKVDGREIVLTHGGLQRLHDAIERVLRAYS